MASLKAASPRSAKSASASPPGQSPHAEPLLAAAEGEGDQDSTLGEDFLSTSSVASSILQYRTIKGRTFHNDKHASTQYFTPNDDQQQTSIDITHHYLTLLLDGKLFLAPIPDTVQKVVDIGTGTGIWTIDFADMYPDAQVVGTDLSPIQPAWVPPNVQFEIDDGTENWTWPDNTIDFVHIRYVAGAIGDWNRLFAEAYRCCTPGGWLESGEFELIVLSDDGTSDPVYDTLWQLYKEGGQRTGCPFSIITDNTQITVMEAAGFTNIQEKTLKVPIGGWPADKNLAEVGRYVQLTIENDIEGYTLYMWNSVMQWDSAEYQVFLMMVRKALRNKALHVYFNVRYVWGQKPEASE